MEWALLYTIKKITQKNKDFVCEYAYSFFLYSTPIDLKYWHHLIVLLCHFLFLLLVATQQYSILIFQTNKRFIFTVTSPTT